MPQEAFLIGGVEHDPIQVQAQAQVERQVEAVDEPLAVVHILVRHVGVVPIRQRGQAAEVRSQAGSQVQHFPTQRYANLINQLCT